MILKDRVWGEFKVDESPLIDIIKNPEFKRLDKISQFGLPFKYYPLPQFTRHEHSIGVMLLLRKLGAGLEEQTAGLLHDTSHTAFSHLVDWVIGDRKREDFQDNRHIDYLKNSSFREIIENHGFNIDDIASLSKYSLLEMPIPNLCADRVDYAMREFQDWANPSIVGFCSAGLENYNGKIVFSRHEDARNFAYSYMKLQREHWDGAEWMLRWQIFSEALKESINKGIIKREDFLLNDEEVLEKIENCEDRSILAKLKKLRGGLNYSLNCDECDYILRKKFRHIDPCYLENGSIKRLSIEEPEYKRHLLEEKRSNNAGWRIKCLSIRFK